MQGKVKGISKKFFGKMERRAGPLFLRAKGVQWGQKCDMLYKKGAVPKHGP